MKRIAFVGGPGCGKTTLTHDVFVQMKKLGYNVELVPEWVRRDIMINGPMQNPYEQYRTLFHHRREEEHFPDSVEYLIQDGGTLLVYFYSALYSNGLDPKEKLVIQDLYGALLDDLYSRKYDHIYFLPRSQVVEAGSHIDDGTRFQTGHEFQVLNDFMRLFFTDIHKMPNITSLDCPLNQRTDRIINDILGESR